MSITYYSMKNELEMIAFHLTWLCKNKCEYCYAGNIERDHHPDLELVSKTLAELAKENIKEILLVGGDPCLYPNLIEVIELIKSYNIRLSLLSNSLFFKNDITFETAIKNVDDIGATILGENHLEHDLVAGKKGAYHLLTDNIRKINQANIPIGIVLNATPRTYDKFYKTIENLVNLEKIDKIRYVLIQRIVPSGRAKGSLKYAIDASQVNVICKDLQKIERDYGLKVVFEDPFPFCVVNSEYHRFLNPCQWGFSKGSVNYSGDVSRCGADTSYNLGNIFKTKLHVIWATSSTLISFRSRKWLPIECQTCKNLDRCGGGCSLSKLNLKEHDSDILCPYCCGNS